MTNSPLETLQRIVRNAKGDDLERARMAFGKMSNEQLDQQYGQSGQTCREILNEYEVQRKEYLAAVELLNKMAQ